MPVFKHLVLAAAAVTLMTGGAEARERAPVEFANRSVRAVEAPRVQVASAAPAQRAASPTVEVSEMLYGYGQGGRASAKAPLDLRGTLRGGAFADLMADDAFDDDAPPVPAAPVVETVEAAEPLPVAPPVAQAATPTPAAGAYFVQVGAFADPSNAERVRTALLDVGAVSVDVREGPSVTLHRVRLGQWASRAEAELARDVIVERGFAGAVVATAR